MTMSTNFDTNAADGIEIDSIFSSAVAYGTADDANNQRRNKKYRQVKSLVFVSTAVVAVIFGWTAFSGMNQPNYAVQGNEMMERNLAKSTKAHTVPATAAPVATAAPFAKSTKAPTVPVTAAPVATTAPFAKSTKAPTVPATAAPVAKSGKVHAVRNGDSIQDAIDLAEPGDTIKVWPGSYTEPASPKYGLRITKNDIKLVAKGKPGRVRLLASNVQETGVYAAPDGCEYEDTSCDDVLQGFSIKGFSVEGFPANGIQTRWVDSFKFQNCYSVDNLNNGIYPTLSSNGSIVGCKSHGSLAAGLSVDGSVDVTAFDNEIYNSTTGFEVTVSKNVYATNNHIHGNVVGIGLYHPFMAGTTPDYSSYDNWVFENNLVYDNNLRPNPAPPGTLRAALFPGVGLLLFGVSNHTIQDNIFKDHEWAGVIVAGFCTVQVLGFQSNCIATPPSNGDPSANFNTIADNKFAGNGANPPFGLPGDILYAQLPSELLPPGIDQNCFSDNTSLDGSENAYGATLGLPLPTTCDDV